MTVIGPNFVFLPGLTPWNLFFPLCLWGINHLEPDPKSSRLDASLPLTAADFGLQLSKLSWVLGLRPQAHYQPPGTPSLSSTKVSCQKTSTWDSLLKYIGESGKAFYLERGHACPRAHQVTDCQSLVRQCLRVHCLALLPPSQVLADRETHISPEELRICGAVL